MTSQFTGKLRLCVRLLAVAFVAAALIGAAQFGIAYGLGALRLDREFLAGTDNEWNLQLTWVAWFALLATIGGAAVAAYLAERETWRVGAVIRTVVTLAAAVGATVAALPLTLQPARYARLSAAFDPELTAAIAIGAAVLVGLVLALLTIARPPLSTNLWCFTAGVWVIAAVSFADTAQYDRSKDALGGYFDPIRLGVLDLGGLAPIPRASFTLPALALLLGLVCGLIGRRSGKSRVLVAASGATGPILVAVAYLIGGPGISRSLTYQADAYLGAMIAVVVGLLASSLVALAPRRRRADRSGSSGTARTFGETVPSQRREATVSPKVSAGRDYTTGR